MSKHIHRYRRAKLGSQIIYKCTLPGCTHYILKALVENRASICHRCGTSFIITKKTLKTCPAMPHCDDCTNRKEDELLVDQALDELIK